MGGLGNQMFQYAIGRSLQCVDEENRQLRLYFEDGYRIAVRQYKLDAFRIAATIATPAELREVGPERKLRRRLKVALHLPIEKHVVREKTIFVWDESIMNISDDVYLIGFWQSHRYFSSIRERLIEDFQLKETTAGFRSKWERIAPSRNSMALHIRRSDYLKPISGFSVLPETYYLSALGQAASRIGDFDIFVFTDDPEWANANMGALCGDRRYEVISHPSITDYEELILMSRCSHQIIANSSFSWWGAWLNDNKDKVIIAPASWNGTDESIPLNDLIPAGWHIVK
jgi:hypothetical protein